MKKILISYVLILISFLLIGCVFGNNEKNHTITEDQWDALVGLSNFSVESKDNEGSLTYNYFHKYTEDVIELDGDIILFIDDKQYLLLEKETGWVASDHTVLNFQKGYLLAGYNFEDFTYDETKKAYVSQIDKQNSWEEIIFENGVLVKITTYILKEDLNEENVHIIENIYTNIGTTTIEVPEYTFEVVEEYVTTVTEEEWNKYMNEYNFSSYYLLFDTTDYSMEKIYQYNIEGGYYTNEKYYVSKDEKIYLLTETDNGWVGEEVDSFAGYKGPLLQGISFSEVEYDENEESYVTKNVDENGIRYYFYFYDGVPIIVYMENTLSPDVYEYYFIEEIGSVLFELPEYTIK